MNIEGIVLSGLVFNEDFFRRVVPFVQPEYFVDKTDEIIYSTVKSYVEKYNASPPKSAIFLRISEMDNLSEHQLVAIEERVEELAPVEGTLEWMVDETEKFCKDRALHNAIRKSIKVIEGQDPQMTRDGLPSLLQEALSVGFDRSVGHDYIEDAESRFMLYQTKEDKIPFDIDLLNEITNGGVNKKTINVFMAGTGVGKSLTMCHMAAANLRAGYDVLYITMEMSEQKIAERIDANLLDCDIKKIPSLQEDVFMSRIDRLQKSTRGRLIIKEYPTGGAHAGHFRALIRELKTKKNFTPCIIYIDYLNICASSRLRGGASGSYDYVKAIAEEVRGLGVEFDVPIITATQTNRTGASKSELELTDTSESFGVPMTADLFCAINSSPELEEEGLIQFKQLKNRYNDLNYWNKFMVGVDKSKMRLFDTNVSVQNTVFSGFREQPEEMKQYISGGAKESDYEDPFRPF